MAHYTTGELAKLCGVSIRTVQYYDRADLLKPDHLTENGRRIYSDSERHTLQLILGYKQLGFSLKDIQHVMGSQQRTTILTILVQRQLAELAVQTATLTTQKNALQFLAQSIQSTGDATLEMTLVDIEAAMNKTAQLKQLHRRMIWWGLLIDLIEIGLIVLGFMQGIWWPMWIGVPVIGGLVGYVMTFYYQSTAYICPACKTQFKPALKAMVFARHTSKTRELVCPHCGQRNDCIEVAL